MTRYGRYLPSCLLKCTSAQGPGGRHHIRTDRKSGTGAATERRGRVRFYDGAAPRRLTYAWPWLRKGQLGVTRTGQVLTAVGDDRTRLLTGLRHDVEGASSRNSATRHTRSPTSTIIPACERASRSATPTGSRPKLRRCGRRRDLFAQRQFRRRLGRVGFRFRTRLVLTGEAVWPSADTRCPH